MSNQTLRERVLDILSIHLCYTADTPPREQVSKQLLALIQSQVKEARIHELKMVIGIDDVWAAPETKRDHHKKRLAELEEK